MNQGELEDLCYITLHMKYESEGQFGEMGMQCSL